MEKNMKKTTYETAHTELFGMSYCNHTDCLTKCSLHPQVDQISDRYGAKCSMKNPVSHVANYNID